MLVVTATLSIAPGHPAAVTAAARKQLQLASARPQCLALLSAEIYEVNTLLALFVGAPLEPLLADVRAWVQALQATPAGKLLRHVQVEVHDTPAELSGLRQLVAAPTAAVLLQVLGAHEPLDARQAIELVTITGTQKRWKHLIPLTHQDQAIPLMRDALANGTDVRDSGLWIPISLPNSESIS